MLSQMANARQFVQNYLSGVVDTGWVQDAGEAMGNKPISTGDRAVIQIKTPYNRYSLVMASPYVEPPAGAPTQCASLGTVEFEDQLEGVHYVEPRSDAAYAKIALHIKRRECKDAVAAIRREMAEASPDGVRALKVKLNTWYQLARPLGIKVDESLVAGIENAPGSPLQSGVFQGHPDPAPLLAPAPDSPVLTGTDIFRALNEAPSYGRLALSITDTERHPRLHVGIPIVYCTNRGEEVGGMGELPGIVVKVGYGNVISALIMANASEPRFIENLHHRSGSIRYNCWDFNPGWAQLYDRLEAQEKELLVLKANSHSVNDVVSRTLDELRDQLRGEIAVAREVAEAVQKAFEEPLSELSKRITATDLATGNIVSGINGTIKGVEARVVLLEEILADPAAKERNKSRR